MCSRVVISGVVGGSRNPSWNTKRLVISKSQASLLMFIEATNRYFNITHSRSACAKPICIHC